MYIGCMNGLGEPTVKAVRTSVGECESNENAPFWAMNLSPLFLFLPSLLLVPCCMSISRSNGRLVGFCSLFTPPWCGMAALTAPDDYTMVLPTPAFQGALSSELSVQLSNCPPCLITSKRGLVDEL